MEEPTKQQRSIADAMARLSEEIRCLVHASECIGNAISFDPITIEDHEIVVQGESQLNEINRELPGIEAEYRRLDRYYRGMWGEPPEYAKKGAFLIAKGE